MSEIVVDVLYIKMMEKMIRRKLTEEEMDKIRYGESLFIQKPNGVWMSFSVPLHRHPYDLMPKDNDPRPVHSFNMDKGSIFDLVKLVSPGHCDA